MKEYYVIFNLNSVLSAFNCFRLHYDRVYFNYLFTLFDKDALRL